MKLLVLWWDSHLSFKKLISLVKTLCKDALNLIRVVADLKWGGDRDTLLMLYRAIVRSKLGYGCIVYGTASTTDLRQLDSIHNSGLRLALGSFWISLVSSLYTEVNEAPFYIQKLVQTKWDVAAHGRDIYVLKPTMGTPKKFQHLTRDEEVVITRLRIGHTKATKSHILSRGPPTGCHHCGQTLTLDHMLLECALLQECRDEYCSRLVECSLQDNSWDLHSGIPARNGVLLSDMM